MKKLKFFLALVFLAFLVLLSLLLTPIKYDVKAFKERKGTQYWQLKTGAKIGYTKIEGLKSSPKNPIIYLHGGPGGMINDNIITVLKPLALQGHGLYFYDQIGSGHSDRLENIKDYSVERHQNDLEEIISKIDADKIILIGHSWGACLAINYLQDHENSIEKIILTGPGPILPINRAMVNQISPDSLSLIAPKYSNKEGNKKAYNWRSKIILKWAYLFNSKLASDKEVDSFFTYLNQELSKSTDCIGKYKKYNGGSGYYNHIMTVKSFNHVANKREQLKKMNTPILIIRGQCDNQKWGFTKEYLDIFVNSELKIIEEVGHNVLKKKERYYELVSNFLIQK